MLQLEVSRRYPVGILFYNFVHASTNVHAAAAAAAAACSVIQLCMYCGLVSSIREIRRDTLCVDGDGGNDEEKRSRRSTEYGIRWDGEEDLIPFVCAKM